MAGDRGLRAAYWTARSRASGLLGACAITHATLAQRAAREGPFTGAEEQFNRANEGRAIALAHEPLIHVFGSPEDMWGGDALLVASRDWHGLRDQLVGFIAACGRQGTPPSATRGGRWTRR